jgi:hypothetical protein
MNIFVDHLDGKLPPTTIAAGEAASYKAVSVWSVRLCFHHHNSIAVMVTETCGITITHDKNLMDELRKLSCIQEEPLFDCKHHMDELKKLN